MKAPFEYNVRLFSYTNQGGRKYMEDAYCIGYQKKRALHSDLDQQPPKAGSDKEKDEVNSEDKSTPSACQGEDDESVRKAKQDLEYVYVGIFDGHGGKEAALFTRDNLLQNIIGQKEFWANDDQLILKAIKEGFIATHYQMLNVVGKFRHG